LVPGSPPFSCETSATVTYDAKSLTDVLTKLGERIDHVIKRDVKGFIFETDPSQLALAKKKHGRQSDAPQVG